jgi:hypothetical protein
MNNSTEKKSIIKNWFPVFLFIISSFIYFTNSIFPNTDFSFYLLLISSLILLISAISHFINERNNIGCLQIIILIIPVFLIGLGMIFMLGVERRNKDKLSQEDMTSLVKDKTDFSLPKQFEVLENKIEHTEEAFGSDYSIILTIEYKESDEKNIIEQILKSAELESDNGSWKKYDSGFDFKHNYKEINRAETFYFKVDTLNNKMELNLNHL